MTNGFMQAMTTTIHTYNEHLAVCGELYTAEEQEEFCTAVSALLSTVSTNLAEDATYDKVAKLADTI